MDPSSKAPAHVRANRTEVRFMYNCKTEGYYFGTVENQARH